VRAARGHFRTYPKFGCSCHTNPGKEEAGMISGN
jgi:hypothetical protein